MRGNLRPFNFPLSLYSGGGSGWGFLTRRRNTRFYDHARTARSHTTAENLCQATSMPIHRRRAEIVETAAGRTTEWLSISATASDRRIHRRFCLPQGKSGGRTGRRPAHRTGRHCPRYSAHTTTGGTRSAHLARAGRCDAEGSGGGPANHPLRIGGVLTPTLALPLSTGRGDKRRIPADCVTSAKRTTLRKASALRSAVVECDGKIRPAGIISRG